MFMDSISALRAHAGTLTGIVSTGLDANVQICSAQFDDDARWQVGPCTSSSAMPTLRSAAFSQFVQGTGLYITNTFNFLGFTHSQVHTYYNAGQNISKQLDYILAKAGGRHCYLDRDTEPGEHVPIVRHIGYQSKSKCNDKFRPKPTNWKLSNPEQYNLAVHENIHQSRLQERDGLEHVSAAIATATKKAGFANSSRPPKADPGLLAEIKDLENFGETPVIRTPRKRS